MTTTREEAHEARLAELCEDYCTALQEGTGSGRQEIARQNPDFAEEIEELFPALEALARTGVDSPAQDSKGPPGIKLESLGESVLSRLGDGAGSPSRFSAITLPGGRPAGNGDAVDWSDRDHEGGGKYQSLGELAHGGIGRVLKGHDVDLGRDVALKMLHEKFTDDSEMLQRFIEEAQIGGQLQHPGIVPVYELGEQDGQPFFAMKLVRGQTLAQLLKEREGPNDERRRFLRILEQVSQTIAYAHSRGVVHRDLKPSNVMVGAFGEVQVVDWGMAKVLCLPSGDSGLPGPSCAADGTGPVSSVRSGETGLISVAGTVFGTPAYMPPEQAAGDVKHLDEHCDVFALGGMLCDVLTGAPPYPGSRDVALDAARDCRLEGALARIEKHSVEPQLAKLVRDCLRADPAQRPRNAGVVAERLGEFLAGAERRVMEARVSARAANRTKKFAMGTALVVLVALLVSLRFWGNADHARQAAEKSLNDFNVLNLVNHLAEVEASLDDIYPAARTDPDRLEAWLAEHWGPLDPHFQGLEQSLARLGNGRLEGADRYLRDTLREVHARFAKFGIGPRSVVARVRADISWSAAVEGLTVHAHAAKWAAAIKAIAASPVYDGMQLAPQVGLVPLGWDPASGFYQFYHLRSASPGSPPPIIDSRSGRFTVTGDTGMVFVLIPGALTTVGSQIADPQEPYYDPQAQFMDRDLRTVLLDPFLISKFELTQGQWLRLTDQELLCEYPAGEPLDWGGPPITLAHPFASTGGQALPWHLLRRNDLLLPREEEWEYACRAGSDEPWYSGNSPASLEGHANVGDLAAGEVVPDWGAPDVAFRDGHVVHAPVGSFSPNPFGLHDMHGNVLEYCLSVARDGRKGVYRGGSFRTPAYRARSSFRRFVGPDHGRGLRLIHPLQPLLFAEARWPLQFDVFGAQSVLCADLDSDGDLDVFCGGSEELPDTQQRAPRNWLFMNDGSGSFQDVSDTHLPTELATASAAQALACDVDGDGDLDLVWVCGGRGARQNRLYLNDGSGHFADATGTRLPEIQDASAALAMGDLDGDGDQDLIVANRGDDLGEQNSLHLNDGTGRFLDATDTHMPRKPVGRVEDSTTAVVLGDVDGDGDLDIIFGNMHYGYQNRLYLNDGLAHFTEATEECMPPTHIDRSGVHGDITFSVDLGDLDGDGDLDLVCGNGYGVRWQRNRLYLNDGHGHFTDVSDSRLPEDRHTTTCTRLGDIDGDGDLDIVSGGQYTRPRVHLNDGKGFFRDVSVTHIRVVGRIPTFALADLDGDGDLDLLGETRLRFYRNLTH